MYAELFQDAIGKVSPIEPYYVSAEAIKRFAESFGDPDPIYTDEEYAKTTPYGQIIAPPTYAFSLTFLSSLPMSPGVKLPPYGLIHGNQDFEYHKPIVANKTYQCQTRLADVKEKTGKNGAMVFLTNEFYVYDENMELCLKMTSNVVCRGSLFDNFDPRLTPEEEAAQFTAEKPAPKAPVGLVDIHTVKEGDVLPDITLPAFDRVEIAKYAGGCGDFNRIHIDDESAQALKFPKAIAHGMMTVALETKVLKQWFGGETQAHVVGMSIKFTSPAVVGIVPTFKATVKSVEGDLVTLAISVDGPQAPIITGTVTLKAL